MFGPPSPELEIQLPASLDRRQLTQPVIPGGGGVVNSHGVVGQLHAAEPRLDPADLGSRNLMEVHGSLFPPDVRGMSIPVHCSIVYKARSRRDRPGGGYGQDKRSGTRPVLLEAFVAMATTAFYGLPSAGSGYCRPSPSLSSSGTTSDAAMPTNPYSFCMPRATTQPGMPNQPPQPARPAHSESFGHCGKEHGRPPTSDAAEAAVAGGGGEIRERRCGLLLTYCRFIV